MQRLHASLRNIPATANYVVNVIGSLYKRIITDWELSELRHPTHGVKLFKMGVRERFLSPEERQRVHEAMEAGLKIPAGRKGQIYDPSDFPEDTITPEIRAREEQWIAEQQTKAPRA